VSRGGAVAAVVLAAGSGSRFGSTKQLALAHDRPLLRLALESIARTPLGEIVVVLGADAGRVASVLAGLPVRIVVNEHHATGMGSSVAAGIGALPAGTAAAVVALGDQPLPPGVVDALVRRWRDGAAQIVVPSYRGTRGNPVLFDASVFPELESLTGDQGARQLIAAAGERVDLVELDVDLPIDVDTADDLLGLG